MNWGEIHKWAMKNDPVYKRVLKETEGIQCIEQRLARMVCGLVVSRYANPTRFENVDYDKNGKVIGIRYYPSMPRKNAT